MNYIGKVVGPSSWRTGRTIMAMAAWMMTGGATEPSQAASTPTPASAGTALITLGTGGGPLSRLNRAQSASAVVVNGRTYLIDAGDGVLRGMAGARLAVGSLAGVFITHNHFDHNGDLGTLLVQRWLFRTYAPLPVFGPPGTAALARGILEANRATELSPIDTGPLAPSMVSTVAPRDLAADLPHPTEIYADKNVRVLAVSNAHYHLDPASPAQAFARSYGYRVETRDRTIVFTGDTGPTPALVELARGADILVSEVIDVPRVVALLRTIPNLSAAAIEAQIAHQRHDHLTPEQVGALARDAGVRRVVLSHVAPGLDNEGSTDTYSAGVKRIYGGPVSVAADLDRF